MEVVLSVNDWHSFSYCFCFVLGSFFAQTLLTSLRWSKTLKRLCSVDTFCSAEKGSCISANISVVSYLVDCLLAKSKQLYIEVLESRNKCSV